MRQPAPAESTKPLSAALAPIRPLLPYVFRQKKRIAFALVALLAAAGATLTLPIAVGGMIDHGFSTGQRRDRQRLFRRSDRGGKRARRGVRLPILSRHHARRTRRRRSARRHFSASFAAGRVLLRFGQDRRIALASDRGHDAAQSGLRLVRLGGSAQFVHVSRGDRHDGRHESQTCPRQRLALFP